MRGTLSILVIAAALAVGLWYLFAPSDPPEVTRSDTDAPVSRPAPAVDDPETADAGTGPAADNVQTKEAAADPTADGVRAADSDSDVDSATDIGQTPEPGATAEAGDAPAADSGADSTTDVAQTSEPDATPREDDTGAAGFGTDSTTDAAQTSESAAMAAPEIAPTIGTGPVPPADAARTTESDAVEAEPRAAAEDAAPSTTAEVVLAPATDGTIERTPIAPAGEPPEDETDPEDVLAAVAGGIERLKNAIEETLGIELKEDADTALRLRIEYDDTPTDAPQTDLEPKEEVETVAADATAAADAAQIADTGTESTAGDAAPPPDIAQTTDTGTESTAGDAAPPPDIAQTTDTGTEPPADPARAIGSDGTISTTPLRIADSDNTPPSKIERTADAGATGDEGPGAEAKQYVETLTATTPPTIPVDKADHFVTQDSVVSLVPEDSIESTTVGDLADDDTLAPDTPITVVREVEQMETAVPEQLIADSGGDLDRPLRIVVTYDDAQQIAETTDTGTEPPAGDAAPPPDVAQTTDTDTEPPAGPTRAIGSDNTPSTVPFRTADSDSTPPSTVERTADAGATGDEGPGAEAKQYVETLAATTPPTIPVDKADHFVTQDSVVSLVPEDSIESTTVGDLADDDTLAPDTPITVVREVEQIETAVPEQLIADSGGDLDRPLRIVVTYDDAQQIAEQRNTDEDAAEPTETTTNVIAEDTSEPIAATRNVAAEDTSAQEIEEQSGVEQITVREALERIRTEPEKPLSIVRTVRHFEVMTLRELLDSREDDGAFLNVVLQPYRIEAATLADLLRLHETGSPDTISYLHTVQPTDEQGIWGIVHFGLIENFARGMAVRRGEEIETYTVRIPRDADERLEDQSSSFLGKLIDRKTKESYVYNFRENRMGRSPDTIYPGQEIVIINFEPGELEAIYEYFAGG